MSVHQASFPFEATIKTVTARDRFNKITGTTTEIVRCQVSGPGNRKHVDLSGTEFAPRAVIICRGLVAKRDALLTLPAQFGLPNDMPIREFHAYANYRGVDYITEVAA